MRRELRERFANAARDPAFAARAGLAPVPSHVPTIRTGRRTVRRVVAATLALLLVGGAVSVPRAMKSITVPGGAAPRIVDLYSAGSAPVTAVVYSPGSGVRLLQLPVGSPQRHTIAGLGAELAGGSVYVLSLGGSNVRVSAVTHPEAPRMGVGTQGRFIRVIPAPAEAKAGTPGDGRN